MGLRLLLVLHHAGDEREHVLHLGPDGRDLVAGAAAPGREVLRAGDAAHGRLGDLHRVRGARAVHVAREDGAGARLPRPEEEGQRQPPRALPHRPRRPASQAEATNKSSQLPGRPTSGW